MPPLAYFGIESSGLNLAVDLLILFVAVFYLSLIYWTYADARRRIVDPMLIGCATAASLFPFVGTIVYMILRPPEYLEDVRERELEMQAAEARLHQLDQALCPHCDYRVERDFVRCPSCLRKLKERCASCSRPLDQAWTICPYCEAAASELLRRITTFPTRAKGTNGPNADPRKARRLRTRPDRRDRRPLRAQGTGDRGAAADDRHPGARRAALCRALRAPVLRRARRLHHLGPDRRDGARGHRCRQGGATADRRHQPAGGGSRLDPWRLRD